MVGDTVSLSVYAAGTHARPVVSGRSGELLILTAGVYDVRAEDTRNGSEAAWLMGLRVSAGGLSETSVTVHGTRPDSEAARRAATPRTRDGR